MQSRFTDKNTTHENNITVLSHPQDKLLMENQHRDRVITNLEPFFERNLTKDHEGIVKNPAVSK